jgi:hypothetical protein
MSSLLLTFLLTIGKVSGAKVKDTIYDFFDDKKDNPDGRLLFYGLKPHELLAVFLFGLVIVGLTTRPKGYFKGEKKEKEPKGKTEQHEEPVGQPSSVGISQNTGSLRTIYKSTGRVISGSNCGNASFIAVFSCP